MSAGRVVESGDVYDVFAAPQQPVTKRFIATALSGLPEEDRVERLHHEWSGRIVTVLIRQRTFPAPKAMNSRHPDRISRTHRQIRRRIQPALRRHRHGQGDRHRCHHLRIQRARLACGRIPARSSPPIATSSTSAPPQSLWPTPTQSPDMPPTPKTAPMTHWRPILPPRPPRPPPHMKEPTHDHPRQPA